MQQINRKTGPLPPHTYLRFCASGAAPIVFCVEKLSHVEATPEQIADFKERREKVIALGGVMYGSEFTIGEKLPPFSKEECAAIRASIQEANPDLCFHSDWNGVGGNSYSVGMMEKRS